jgi:hypothetical protein
MSLVIDGRSSRRLSKADKDKSWIKDNVVEEKVFQKSLEDSFTETMKVIDDFVIDCDDIVSDFDKIASRMQDSVASDSSPMSMSSHVVGEGFIDEMETEVQDIINAGQLILSSKLEKINKMKNPTTSVTANSSTSPTSVKTTQAIGDVIRAYSDMTLSVNTASSKSPTSKKTPHVVKKVIRAKGDNSWIKSRVSSQKDSAPNTESLSTSTMAETSLQQAVIATSTSPSVSVSVEESKISQQIVAPRDNSWMKSNVSSKEESATHTESLSASILAETSLQQSVIVASTSQSVSVSVEEAKISQQRVVVAPRGKLGIVVANTILNGRVGPAVHTVREGSPLEGLIHVNDVIVAINDVDTSKYTVGQLTKLMAASSEQERRITLQSTTM